MSHLNINGVDKPLDHVYVNNVRTENLFDTSTITLGKYINSQGVETESLASTPIDKLNHTDYIKIQPNTDYTYHYKYISGVQNTMALNWFDASKNLISRITKNIFEQDNDYTLTGTSPANAAFCIINFAGYLPNESMELSFNVGSTALPYEPYLITKEAWEAKSRVILHGLTNPLCGIDTYKDTLDLSTGPLTRYIMKLVLDGTESWTYHKYLDHNTVDTPLPYSGKESSAVSAYVRCSHYRAMYGNTNEICRIISNQLRFYDDTRAADVTTWKSYLASQYAAGTPVTVWYVLATPTTETITVPSNLTGIVEGYLTQSSTPSPTSPVYPTANGALEQGGTYSLDTGAYAIAWGRADTFIGTNSISARCYGLPVKSWEIDGNSRQSGTPAPDNIIMPEFVGERTGNLWAASGFSAMAIGSTHTHAASNDYGTTLSNTTGKETEITQVASGYGTTAYQNGFFYFDVDFSEFSDGDKLVLSFDYNVTNRLSTVTSTVAYVGASNNAKSVYTTSENWGESGTAYVVFSISSDIMYPYIEIRLCGNSIKVSNVQLTRGTTLKPYEPYGYAIQTYSSIQNTVSGQTPLTLTDSVGHNLISWDGEGATTSSGTPAPTSPVTVSGWGDRTENLFDKDRTNGIIDNSYINTASGISSNDLYCISYPIYLTAGETYTWRFDNSQVHSAPTVGFYDASNNLMAAAPHDANVTNFSFTVPSGCAYVRCSVFKNLQSEAMLNIGSTALPHEPYGYKLSVTSAGQTRAVYLGQVLTTRRVKKYEITGQEPDLKMQEIITATNAIQLPTTINDYKREPFICSHMTVTNTSSGSSTHGYYGQQLTLCFAFSMGLDTLEKARTYLQQQYAAGTPVTVWYVLAEPTTGIVNEPLMKIGDYADSITSTQAGVTIPTAKGTATLTTSNTVQPSTMHATYDKYISGGDVPVYLGQVPTTRKVKKLVLTGNEAWIIWNGNYFSSVIDGKGAIATILCTHFINSIQQGISYNWTSSSGLKIASAAVPFVSSVDELKAWLASQYATGMPVTVWYVLATPETSIVNEPLCKIGDYADILTSDQAGVTIPTTDGNNTISIDATLAPSKFEVKVHAKPIHYGFKIDKSVSDPSNAVIYTHDAVTMTPAGMDFTNGVFDYGSWENVWFIKGARPVMLNFDGSEAYDLDPNDYSKKLDGTPSDIANSTKNMNAMIAFPTVWIKRTDDASYNYIEISDQQIDSDFHAYAHEDANGVVKPYIYLPIYKGSMIDGKLRSISGVKPQSNTTAPQEVDAASALGTGWQIWDYTSKEMLCDLLTLISKSLDTQGKFGQGYSRGGGSEPDFLDCGTLNDKGKFFGYSTETSQVKCFGMEALWAERLERELGIILDTGVYKIKEHPAYNLTGEGYTAISTSVAQSPTSNGYIKTEVSTQYGNLPTALGATTTTYYCDYFYQNQSDIRIALRGGFYSGDAHGGLRYLLVNNTASLSNLYVGASPVYK